MVRRKGKSKKGLEKKISGGLPWQGRFGQKELNSYAQWRIKH